MIGRVTIGSSLFTGNRTINKSNTANGSICGDGGNMPMLAGRIYDPEMVDAPMNHYGVY